jgi:hypothetical protein
MVVDASRPCEHRRLRDTEDALPQPGLMRAVCGNPVRVRCIIGCIGKPTVRRAQFLGGNRMPKKRMPVAEKQQESEGGRPAPPLVASYNWPDTRPSARTRKRADVWQVSL